MRIAFPQNRLKLLDVPGATDRAQSTEIDLLKFHRWQYACTGAPNKSQSGAAS
jgi:hypothetical protein